jgi:integrase
MRTSFRRACKAAKIIPAPRVYDLRHAFATELYRQTGDPKATAEMLMHTPSSRRMDRYTIGGIRAAPPAGSRSFQQDREDAEMAGSRGWQCEDPQNRKSGSILESAN